MIPLVILGLALIGCLGWYLYYRYSEEYIWYESHLKPHSETVKEFLTEAHDKKYSYDLTNPVHEKLNAIPYEERLKIYLPLRERDKYLHEYNPRDHRCTVEVYINRGVPSYAIKSELLKIQKVMMQEYQELNKNDGTNWRISDEWIKEHLKKTIEEYYLIK